MRFLITGLTDATLMAALFVAALAPDSARAATAAERPAGLQFLPAEMQELSELRVPTDRFRDKADGTRERIYDLKRPASGNTFLNLRLYVVDAGDGVTFTREDFALQGSDGSMAHPFDWFQEVGLEEQRADSVTVVNQGILNLTWDVPGEGLRERALIVAGRTVGRLGGIRARGFDGVTFLVDSVREVQEVRLKTDRMRARPDGSQEPVYELHTPRAGFAYLEVVLLVVNEAGAVELSAGDLRVESPTESGIRYLPFDWFLEQGLEEIRGDVLTLPEQGILRFTVELPRDGMLPLRVLAGGQDLGPVQELLKAD